MNSANALHLTLASGSRYKQSVLAKLGIPFSISSPDIDESPLPHETAETLVLRLAREKALHILKTHTEIRNTEHFIIGVDQVALHNNNILGKPHTREKAIAQLKAFSAQEVVFLTGIAVCHGNGTIKSKVEKYRVAFKTLTEQQIIRYVDAESPLDCAGAFKSEGAGILLFNELAGRDINALVGMPLLAFQELMMEFNVDLFEHISENGQ